VTEPAFALRTVQLPPGSQTRIGLIAERNSSGQIIAIRAWAGSSNNSGADCSWAHLGTNGLADETHLVGSAQAEIVIVVTANTQWCGQTLAPLPVGRECVLWGRAGNDTLAGGSVCEIEGEDGNDVVSSNLTDGTVRGGNGNDILVSGGSTFLSGGFGNDRFCTPFFKIVREVSGHAGGFDVLCGTAHAVNGIDDPNHLNCTHCQ